MGYSTRKALRKQIVMASGNMDDALAHLLRVKDTLRPEHPDIADNVEGVMKIVLGVEKLIDSLLDTF